MYYDMIMIHTTFIAKLLEYSYWKEYVNKIKMLLRLRIEPMPNDSHCFPDLKIVKVQCFNRSAMAPCKFVRIYKMNGI